MKGYDVIVAGGGPSGSIAARILATSGAKVLLIEKDLKRIKPCGGATPLVSFDEFNIPRAWITRKINTLSAISPKGVRVDLSLKGESIAMVERGVFDNALRRQAEESGAEIIEAELQRLKVQGFFASANQHGRKVSSPQRINTAGKVQITILEKGKERLIASDFLIAADGVNSRIAHSLGLKPLPCLYTIQEDIDIYSTRDLYSNGVCEFWFGSAHAPGCYSWVFPKKDYINIGTGSTDGKALKGLMENFKMRLGINTEGRQKVYRLPLRQRRPLVYENIILFAGDAGGLVMPLSYEGIYYAMMSGRMAAEAIIRGRAEDYEKEWNKRFLMQFALMGRLKRYFLKDDKSMERLIELHKMEEVQKAWVRLLLQRDLSILSLNELYKFFKRFLT